MQIQYSSKKNLLNKQIVNFEYWVLIMIYNY
jgi:hypothetical protein